MCDPLKFGYSTNTLTVFFYAKPRNYLPKLFKFDNSTSILKEKLTAHIFKSIIIVDLVSVVLKKLAS